MLKSPAKSRHRMTNMSFDIMLNNQINRKIHIYEANNYFYIIYYTKMIQHSNIRIFQTNMTKYRPTLEHINICLL